MGVLFEQILPLGRAVRFEKVQPKTVIDIQERVALEIGDMADPGGGRRTRRTDEEIYASCLKQITAAPVLEMEAGKIKVPDDLDAFMRGIPESAWIHLTHEMLITPGHQYYLYNLFPDIEDFVALKDYIGAASIVSRQPNPFVEKRRILSY